MPKSEAHKWVFAPRFRRNAFGWRSQPAVQRVKEAIAEIQKVARKNPVLAAGHGYEITGIEVLAAYSATMEGARNAATVDQTRSRIRELLVAFTVQQILGSKKAHNNSIAFLPIRRSRIRQADSYSNNAR